MDKPVPVFKVYYPDRDSRELRLVETVICNPLDIKGTKLSIKKRASKNGFFYLEDLNGNAK